MVGLGCGGVGRRGLHGRPGGGSRGRRRRIGLVAWLDDAWPERPRPFVVHSALMGRSTVAFVGTLVVLAGWGSTLSDLKPGDRLGRMTLVRGTVATADQKLFDICNPIGSGGTSHRSCGLVPRVRKLFIGYGLFAPPRQINTEWARTRWSAWLDGHRIRLAEFGRSDRTLFAFPPAGGKDVTLREWRVMLVGATPSRHTLRYRSQDPSGTGDNTTWTFTVAR
jgi:hypothetical protein